MRKIADNYKEVKIDSKGIDRFYKNPLTKTYQYEYAVYMMVAELFLKVIPRSMCIESLKLYFKELPGKSEDLTENEPYDEKEENENPSDAKDGNTDASKKKTKRNVLMEAKKLVERDLMPNITFPMMNRCAAEVRVVPMSDGTHTFMFTDGVYGFTFRVIMGGKGSKKKIEVRDLAAG